MGDCLRVLELYSGIGGMHCALRESGISTTVVGAADINTTANQIYKHNFPDVRVITRTIEAFTEEDLNKLSMDMILMSPPCQPYTRLGKQRDSEDKRAQSFLHLLNILPRLKKLPNYILLENVKGFDTSHTRELTLAALRSCDYQIQEFLLTPLQFGVPNARLRYYMLAKRRPLEFHFPIKEQIWETLPECAQSYIKHRCDKKDNVYGDKSLQSSDKIEAESSNTKTLNKASMDIMSTEEKSNPPTKKLCQNPSSGPESDLHILTSSSQSDDLQASGSDDEGVQSELPLHERFLPLCRPISDFLTPDLADDKYLVPEKFYKRFWVMDIVTPDSKKCICFTKGYAHHIEGTGSILQMGDGRTVASLKSDQEHNTEIITEVIQRLQLRFFTPREVANLMCFPSDYSFPEDFSTIQLYRVLGNSLNVHVVAVLLKALTFGDFS